MLANYIQDYKIKGRIEQHQKDFSKLDQRSSKCKNENFTYTSMGYELAVIDKRRKIGVMMGSSMEMLPQNVTGVKGKFHAWNH